MQDARYKELIAHRAQLIDWLMDAKRGNLPSRNTPTPEIVGYVKEEVARLSAVIAKDRFGA